MRVLSLAVLAACSGAGPVDTGVLTGPPVISHQPSEGPWVAGEPQDLQFEVTDPDGLVEVTVWVRTGEGLLWQNLSVEPSGSVFEVALPGEWVAEPVVAYAIEATDLQGLHSWFPSDGQDDPVQVPVVAGTQQLPFEEDFESGQRLGELGWHSESKAFPAVPWRLAQPGASGVRAAYHDQSAPDVGEIDDWLVSPVLDLGVDDAQLVFTQRGELTPRMGTHSLWIGPADGDIGGSGWQLVAELEAPLEQEWLRAELVDLTPWTGSTARLAWRYQGTEADRWWIDDVRVSRLGPDLVLEAFGQSELLPGVPGEVTARLRNVGLATAGPVEVNLVVDPARATVAGTDQLPQLRADDEAEAAVSVTVDAGQPLDQALPVILTATDGRDSWAWNRSILVGQASSAEVAFSLAEQGLVLAWVGKGDPGAPRIEVPIVSDILPAGAHAASVDLTSLAAELPPTRADRWWLRWEATVAGEVTSFTVDTRGTPLERTSLGGFGAEPSLYWLPERPQPVVSSIETLDGEPLAPGATDTLVIRLDNVGAATEGETTVSAVALDPDLEILTPGPFPLGDAAGWSGSGSFSMGVRVASAHTDSSSLPVELRVTDTIEQQGVPLELEVPWPQLEVTDVVLDDASDGNADGQWQVGEVVEIRASFANTGALSSDPATCVLQGPPQVELLIDRVALAALPPGGLEQRVSFEAVLRAGLPGDTLLFEVTCDESSRSWELQFELAVEAPLWRRLHPLPDARGDALRGSADLRWVRWRVVDEVLELRIRSFGDLPATQFLDLWMDNVGSTWSWHDVIVDQGQGTVYGYSYSTWTPLAPVQVTSVAPDELELSFELSNLGLVERRLLVGVGAGFCGSPYYCDSLPEGWGDPFQTGFDTSLWGEITW